MARKDKEEVVESGIPVIAEEPCYYDNVYRKEGDKFSVENENQISRVMRRLDGKPHPKDVKDKPKKEAKSGGPEIRELKQPETIADAKDHLI